jgi:DUF1707 SHOCT-like domain
MGDPSKLRIADADREQLVDELREHTIAGRLTSEELEERIGRAYRARTRADLERLKADLPVSSTSVRLALSRRRAQLRRRLVQEAGGSIALCAICVGIWLADGAGGSFWPGWVIAFTLLVLLRDAWRLFGPASDLEVVHARLQARHERRLARGHRHRYRGLPW